MRPRSSESLPYFEEGKFRFLEEAKRIADFKNDPGVVGYLDFFRANNTAYLAMELIDGMSLAALLSEREAAGRPFVQKELLAIVSPILTTLKVLHEANVLHRDIKPSNILVRRSDQKPVLIDFGSAKEQISLQSKSAAPFTEGYAALEQVGEGELGPWTDVYAVGAVMWRIVAGGMPPWHPPNPKRVELRAASILRGKRDPLPAAAELGAGRFSSSVLDVIDYSLKVLQTDRPRDCIELAEKLKMATEHCDPERYISRDPMARSKKDVSRRSKASPPATSPPSPYISKFQRLATGLVFCGLYYVILYGALARFDPQTYIFTEDLLMSPKISKDSDGQMGLLAILPSFARFMWTTGISFYDLFWLVPAFITSGRVLRKLITLSSWILSISGGLLQFLGFGTGMMAMGLLILYFVDGVVATLGSSILAFISSLVYWYLGGRFMKWGEWLRWI